VFTCNNFTLLKVIFFGAPSRQHKIAENHFENLRSFNDYERYCKAAEKLAPKAERLKFRTAVPR
jgi:hypothetical protein